MKIVQASLRKWDENSKECQICHTVVNTTDIQMLQDIL
jgi:hypothetical protein